MQALNYPAQAVRSIRELVAHGRRRDLSGELEEDWLGAERQCRMIQYAQHFQLPDGGHIFNDKLKGIQGREAHLPYGITTVSYRIDKMVEDDAEGGTFDGSSLVRVPKRVVIAMEFPTCLSDRFKSSKVFQDFNIEKNVVDRLFPGCTRFCYISAIFGRNDGFWFPCYSSVLVPLEMWDGTGYQGPRSEVPTFMREPSGAAFMGKVVITSPGFYKQFASEKGKEYAYRCASHDIGGEAIAVLELCEALTCTNVHEHVIQHEDKKLNARRARDGKLPILETKVLMVDVPKHKHAAKPWQGGHHATPRYHLCSGHMRSWPRDPTKNIWIEDYARGDRSKGEVRKTYRIRSNDAITS